MPCNSDYLEPTAREALGKLSPEERKALGWS